jgi:hypothetical protein
MISKTCTIQRDGVGISNVQICRVFDVYEIRIQHN